MKLAVHKRTAGKKGDNNKLRREGHVPGILYGQGFPEMAIHIKADELHAILRNMKSGLLATTVFELADGSKKHKAVVKDIQYHVATYDVQHIDFALVSDDKPVTVNVPIQLLGAADCAGIKLGGFLRQAIRTLKVSCLPKDIPQEFVIDVRELGLGQSKTLADIQIPANVRPLAKLDGVAVIVGKKAGT